jgi:hypothetical protein
MVGSEPDRAAEAAAAAVVITVRRRDACQIVDSRDVWRS